MNAGDAFYLSHRSADGHLWVIISDPDKDAGRVLFVSMTSYDVTKEDACLIEAGEHPRVTHRTCINYQLTRHSAGDVLDRLRDTNFLRMQPPVSGDLLARIRRGVSRSRRIAFEHVEFLAGQDLLD